MAKTPKLKKSQQTSLHSRAARRQTETTPPPTTKSKASTGEDQPWLYHAQNAGISKKKKVKTVSRRKHARQKEKRENALRNGQKLEKKVEESVRKGRKIKARREEFQATHGGNDVGGKVLDGEAVGDGEGEEGAEDGVRNNGADGRTWAEKMVEVELEEAMDEIEGFALPTLSEEKRGLENVEPELATKDASDAVVLDVVDEVT